ncbi:diaminopimelate epimerase [Telmatocola sphagniphila]|jgi:diaminopimelate epimerase|uniref:Diaminopimelate epimerase n=1 Tax=Telmatocola sphagniphila TaxID=1123043 RepID=A0A8E6EVX1_9BACT|nr:diaminopimelate epimerase [Telmatocola sphagniphila]QVL33340.1 diaminopimelate epimerase [Telmatocola sphagniphila]
MKFTKMQGAGNDYVYVDCFREKFPADPAKLSRAVSDRHFGIGSDGMILICPSEKADARMRMFNSDGSEGEMCGNGLRCVAKYVYDHGISKNETLKLETGRGILTVDLLIEQGKVHRAKVNMGEPILLSEKIPTTLPGDPPKNVPLNIEGTNLEVTCVSMGNPHCVIFVPEITDHQVLLLGPQLEKHPAFPRRINVEWIQVLSRSEARMRVWERGSGETLACGTGACGATVAGILTGRFDRSVKMHLLGGDLELHWSEKDNHVYMTGPAAEVFSGEWPT